MRFIGRQTRCQFHQHFTSVFFCTKVFCAYFFCLQNLLRNCEPFHSLDPLMIHHHWLSFFSYSQEQWFSTGVQWHVKVPSYSVVSGVPPVITFIDLWTFLASRETAEYWNSLSSVPRHPRWEPLLYKKVVWSNNLNVQTWDESKRSNLILFLLFKLLVLS